MNFKTWLLGSAAMLSTLSGAMAADAVIAPEPEPAEYVRACDVYGKGFIYVPGTETCFSFNGYVRFDTIVAGNPATNLEGDEYQVSTAVRSRLNFDLREETELGTLRAFIRLQNTNLSGSDNDVEIDQAYLQLGGLLAGYRDTMWSSGIGDIEDGLLTDTDLVVGDFNTNQINYTVASNGFSLTVGLEDDGTGDVVPDVHAKLVYLGDWGGLYLSAVYDETFNFEDARDAIGLDAFTFNGVEIFPISLPGLPRILDDGNNDAFALKGGVYLKDVLLPESQLKIEGHYAFDPTVYSAITGLATTSAFTADNPNVLNPTPGAVPIFLEWAAGAGYAQGFGNLGVAVAGQYGETFDTQFFGTLPNGQFGTFSTTGDYYAFVGNLGYKFTPNFASLAEVVYRKVDFDRVGDTDQVTGFLRFQRDF